MEVTENELARSIFGTARAIADAVSAMGLSTVVEGTAMADSEGGYVLVDLGGEGVGEDAGEAAEGEDERDPDDVDWDEGADDRNLSPLLDAGADDGSHWVSLGVVLEDAGEGWARVTHDNSGGPASVTLDAMCATVDGIEAGEAYTLLLEVRPHIDEAQGDEDEEDGESLDPDDVYEDDGDQDGVPDDEDQAEDGDGGADGYDAVASVIPTTTGSQFEATDAVLLEEQTTHLTLTASGAASPTSLLGTRFVVPAGEALDVEVRMSLYQGEYSGDYVPYGLAEGGAWQLVPCTSNVREGDVVLVTIQNNSPVDARAVGSGDRLAESVRQAEELASQAERIASAVGQFAWNDSGGTHVSTEEGVSEGTRNILMNSYGILLRAAAMWLAALTESGVAFYDGEGNAASNVVASFGGEGAVIGKEGETHVSIDSDSVDVVDGETSVTALSMGYDGQYDTGYINSPPYFRIDTEENESDGSFAHVNLGSEYDGGGASLSGGHGMTEGTSYGGSVSAGSSTGVNNNSREGTGTVVTNPSGSARLMAHHGAFPLSNLITKAYVEAIARAATSVINLVSDSVEMSAPTPVLRYHNTAHAAQSGKDVPASNETYASLEQAYDRTGYNMFYHQVIKSSADTLYANYVIRRKVASGSEVLHGLYLYVDADGTRRVGVTEAAPWRNALGASSGVWPVSAGGTGTSAKPLAAATFDFTVGSTASGANATGSGSVAKSGYVPVGVLDWWWASGTRQNFLNNYGCHLEGSTFYWRFCNMHPSSAASGTLRVRVLYAASTIV